MIASDSFGIQDIIVSNKLLRVCLERNIPFASFQQPGESDITTLIQHQAAPRELNSYHDITSAKGFVVAPFNGDESFPPLLLEPDFVHRGNLPVDAIVETLLKCSQFVGIMAKSYPLHQATPSEFTAQVEAIRAKIREGAIDKVVLSRIMVDHGIDGVDLIALFNALCQSYPGAFVYLLQMPGAGCWIGASPEPLLLVAGNRAQTTSIAGTQVLGDNQISDITWKAKELDEQAIVTGYIEAVLESFAVTNVRKSGPQSYQAANLVHLRTQFEFDAAAIKPRLGAFVHALQPTPSVCGLPKAAAKELLMSIEKHNREYYSGYLGPINFEDKTTLFVNLRCMKVVAEGFAFFVGAGITEGSIPGCEWDETNHKMMTLLSVVSSVKKSSNSYGYSKTGN